VPPPLGLNFVLSAPKLSGLPPTPAEVAVVGRSNVGKSSLINALANRKGLAHVSKTPGRTQLLNLFQLADGTTLVDLPGYGFAAAPGRVRSGWRTMIEGYLNGRQNLRRILVLVDGEIGPTKLDLQMLDWLRASDLPLAVVATKQDKVKPSIRQRRAREVAAACQLDPAEVVWVSASSGAGIERLRSLVLHELQDEARHQGPS
jgi:GTP-binding protein